MLLPIIVNRVILLISCTFFAACVTRYLWLGQYFPFTGPSVHCDGSVFDFGTAKSGETIRHVFRVANHGRADLEILQLRTDCGCTVAKSSTKTVSPGEYVDVAADLSLVGLEGEVKKRVLIETNDARNPLAILMMRGNVEADIHAKPRKLIIDESNSSVAAREHAIDLFCNDNVTFDVTGVSCRSSDLNVHFETIEKGKRYRLYVARSTADSSMSELKTQVLVRTSHPRESLLVIPVAITQAPSL